MSPGCARAVLHLFGWSIEGSIPEGLKKYVLIAAPHTSWWDFPLGLLVRGALGKKIYFLGKASLFKWPFGWLMRLLGGFPVDRSRRMHLVEQVVEMFRAHEEFAVAMAPEGTRRKVRRFKTGFYYIARGAEVPVICAALDFAHRKVVFSKPYSLSDDADLDLHMLWNHFAGIRGKRPEKGIEAV